MSNPVLTSAPRPALLLWAAVLFLAVAVCGVYAPPTTPPVPSATVTMPPTGGGPPGPPPGPPGPAPPATTTTETSTTTTTTLTPAPTPASPAPTPAPPTTTIGTTLLVDDAPAKPPPPGLAVVDAITSSRPQCGGAQSAHCKRSYPGASDLCRCPRDAATGESLQYELNVSLVDAGHALPASDPAFAGMMGDERETCARGLVALTLCSVKRPGSSAAYSFFEQRDDGFGKPVASSCLTPNAFTGLCSCPANRTAFPLALPVFPASTSSGGINTATVEKRHVSFCLPSGFAVFLVGDAPASSSASSRDALPLAPATALCQHPFGANFTCTCRSGAQRDAVEIAGYALPESTSISPMSLVFCGSDLERAAPPAVSPTTVTTTLIITGVSTVAGSVAVLQAAALMMTLCTNVTEDSSAKSMTTFAEISGAGDAKGWLFMLLLALAIVGLHLCAVVLYAAARHCCGAAITDPELPDGAVPMPPPPPEKSSGNSSGADKKSSGDNNDNAAPSWSAQFDIARTHLKFPHYSSMLLPLVFPGMCSESFGLLWSDSSKAKNYTMNLAVGSVGVLLCLLYMALVFYYSCVIGYLQLPEMLAQKQQAKRKMLAERGLAIVEGGDETLTPIVLSLQRELAGIEMHQKKQQTSSSSGSGGSGGAAAAGNDSTNFVNGPGIYSVNNDSLGMQSVRSISLRSTGSSGGSAGVAHGFVPVHFGSDCGSGSSGGSAGGVAARNSISWKSGSSGSAPRIDAAAVQRFFDSDDEAADGDGDDRGGVNMQVHDDNSSQEELAIQPPPLLKRRNTGTFVEQHDYGNDDDGAADDPSVKSSSSNNNDSRPLLKRDEDNGDGASASTMRRQSSSIRGRAIVDDPILGESQRQQQHHPALVSSASNTPHAEYLRRHLAAAKFSSSMPLSDGGGGGSSVGNSFQQRQLSASTSVRAASQRRSSGAGLLVQEADGGDEDEEDVEDGLDCSTTRRGGGDGGAGSLADRASTHQHHPITATTHSPSQPTPPSSIATFPSRTSPGRGPAAYIVPDDGVEQLPSAAPRSPTSVAGISLDSQTFMQHALPPRPPRGGPFAPRDDHLSTVSAPESLQTRHSFFRSHMHGNGSLTGSAAVRYAIEGGAGARASASARGDDDDEDANGSDSDDKNEDPEAVALRETWWPAPFYVKYRLVRSSCCSRRFRWLVPHGFWQEHTHENLRYNGFFGHNYTPLGARWAPSVTLLFLFVVALVSASQGCEVPLWTLGALHAALAVAFLWLCPARRPLDNGLIVLSYSFGAVLAFTRGAGYESDAFFMCIVVTALVTVAHGCVYFIAEEFKMPDELSRFRYAGEMKEDQKK